MIASTLRTDNAYTLTERADPEPGPGEVLVRVAYAGVQWGDVLLRDGHFPAPRPVVGGYEASGTIVGVGGGVDPARVGEPVVALCTGGAFAELVVVPEVLAIEAVGVDLRTAGAFGWVTPAAHDLVRTVGRVEPGNDVLVHAATGGVGTVAAQYARLAGARRIVGVVGRRGDAEHAHELPIDSVIASDDFPAAVADESFDVILDPIGGATRERNLELLAPHGRLVVYGNIASWDPVLASINDLLMQGKSLLTYNSNLLSQTSPDRLARSAAAAMAHVREGTIRLQITSEYPFDEVGAAVERLAAGGSVGKIIVNVQERT